MTYTTYTDAELRQIAQINDDQHIGLLTQCGINRDMARKIMTTGAEELAKTLEIGKATLARFAGTEQEASIAGRIEAVRRETAIRQA